MLKPTLAAAGPAGAAILINDATLGRYNSGIGDLASDAYMSNATFNGAAGIQMFPGSNDASVTFTTAPDFSGAAAGIQAALGAWLATPAAPGGSWTAPQAIPATWTGFDETAIIYEFSSAAGLDNVVASIGADNGVYVWLDGVFVVGHRDPGVATAGEYSVSLGNLAAGTHYLQILREDHGGITGWTIEVTGDVVPGGDAVPAPASLALFGAALTGLGIARRRG